MESQTRESVSADRPARGEDDRRQKLMSEHASILYVLCHRYRVNDGNPDREETIMKELYYSLSPEKCRDQIPFYLSLPGFSDFPNGFDVMEIKVENRYWETGFVQY